MQNKILIGLAILTFSFLFQCSNRNIEKQDSSAQYLPEQVIDDQPRSVEDFLTELSSADINTDQTREGNQFNFATLLKTQLNFKINLFDIEGAIYNNDDANALVGNVDAVVFIKNAKNNQIIFSAKTNQLGEVSGEITIKSSLDKCILEVVKSKFHKRIIEIDDFAKYASINRVIAMGQSLESQTNNDLIDSDGDKIPDVYDAFKNDPSRAFSTSFPEDDYLTVAFEDNFPSAGDLDFNDAIFKYRIIKNLDADNKVVEIFINSEAVAKIAGYDHRFGMVVNFSDSQAQVEVFRKKYLGAYGAPETQTAVNRLDVTLFNKTSQSFTTQTIENVSYKYGDSTAVRIKFSQPIEDSTIDAIPFDPYIYVYNTQYDIHLLGKNPLPNTKNPPATFASGFRDSNGYPRALLVPSSWAPPAEQNHIENVYPQFVLWREAIGQSNSDWYLFPNANDTVNVSKPAIVNSQTYPAIELIPNTFLNGMDWSLGGGVSGCINPDIDVTTGIIDGEKWQEHALCIFGIAANDTRFNRADLHSRLEAVNVLTTLINQLKQGGSLVSFSESQIAQKLVQAMTLRQLSVIDIQKIETSLVNIGFEGTMTSLYSKWYNSASYNSHFDFSLKPYYGKSWLLVSGLVKAADEMPVFNAQVRAVFDGVENSQFELLTDNMGSFDHKALINNSYFSLNLRLNINAATYQPTMYSFVAQANLLVIEHIRLKENGEVTKVSGGILTSSDGTIVVNFPSGAINGSENFQVSELGILPDPLFSQVKTKQFEFSPSYQFSKPVILEVKVDSNLLQTLEANPGELSLFQYIDNKLVEVDSSFFDNVSGKLTAEIHHFSVFVIRKGCAYAVCEVLPINSSNLAKTLMGPVKVNIPEGIPAFRANYRQLLLSNGWDPNSFDEKFDQLQLQLGTECPETLCPKFSFDVKEKLQQQLPVDFQTSGTIDGGVFGPGIVSVVVSGISVASASVNATAVVEIQTEYCKINPYACPPKFRINQIDSTNINFNANINVANVTIRYPSGIGQIGQDCWWFICVPRLGWVYNTESFSHTISVTINGLNQQIKRTTNQNGDVEWYFGSAYNSGEPNITVSYEARANLARSMYSDSLINNLRNQLRQMRNNAKETALEALNLSGYSDPEYNEENCLNAPGYQIGGNISGLNSGDEVQLSLNNLFTTTISSNGSYSFEQKLGSGAAYEVQILSTPEGKGCLIENETGIVSNTDITTISITCNALFPSITSTGSSHTCGIINGSAQCWGRNEYGMLGDGTRISRSVPTQVTGLSTNTTFLSASTTNTCAINNGFGYCWGRAGNMHLGDGIPYVTGPGIEAYALTPSRVLNLQNVTKIASEQTNACAVSEGEVFCWGLGSNGVIGNGSFLRSNIPDQKVLNLSSAISIVKFSDFRTVCAADSFELKCWGRDPFVTPSVLRSIPVLKYSGINIQDFAIANTSLCVLDNGSVKCIQQIVDENNNLSYQFTPVNGLQSGVSAIRVRNTGQLPIGLSYFVIKQGALYGWGSNFNGILGFPANISNVTTPTIVPGMESGVTHISDRLSSHACAVKNNSLYCWGDNSDGKLGLGISAGVVYTPQLVSGFIGQSSLP